jgi:hypothetical protein
VLPVIAGIRDSAVQLVSVLGSVVMSVWGMGMVKVPVRSVLGVLYSGPGEKGWEIAHAAASRRPSNPSNTLVARAESYVCEAKAWALSLEQGAIFHRAKTLSRTYAWNGKSRGPFWCHVRFSSPTCQSLKLEAKLGRISILPLF